MGWNRLDPVPGRPCALLPGDHAPYVYFVHSYYAVPADEDIILATCEYGVRFPAIVGRDNVFACQFHPEKSQEDGINLLRAFGDLCKVTT
jgi:glutamine amidotransferase